LDIEISDTPMLPFWGLCRLPILPFHSAFQGEEGVHYRARQLWIPAWMCPHEFNII
jgi:hypothetical protein